MLGFIGQRRRWDADTGARLLLLSGAALLTLTVVAGPSYWGLAFGPALACFVPAGLAAVDRYRASTSARNLPV